MGMYDVIEKKRDRLKLSEEDIKLFIEGVTDGSIPDYQTSALLMAIVLNGMEDDEIFYLTKSMLESGQTLDLSGIGSKIVDKHSTGGIGDKTTLIIGPIVASCGLKFAKLSGRGLGFTGGTLDKLESIAGFRIDLSQDEFLENVKRINICICGQTGNLVPADKKLYALRDVTATVDSIPLIASSIMSKKLAVSSDSMLIDVKVGSGAFMKNMEDARALARQLISIGSRFGREVVCYLTNMEEPLGTAVGNSLEVLESIEILKNGGDRKLRELCVEFSAELLALGGIADDKESGRAMVEESLESGRAYDKLEEMVRAQGGDIGSIQQAGIKIEAVSESGGYVAGIDAEEVGKSALILGAGRENKDSAIDHSVGIVLNKKVGDKVEPGDALACIYASSAEKASLAIEKLLGAYSLSANEVPAGQTVLDIIR